MITCDLCFVTAPQNKGWILDRICKEIGKVADEAGAFCDYAYRLHLLPQASAYFVSHYSLVPQMVMLNKHINIGDIVVFFTHTSSDLKEFIPYFNACRMVIAECQFYYNELISLGVKEEKITWIPEGSDPAVFKPHDRTGKGAILFSGSYRRRKNFDQLLEIAKEMPEHKFIFVTRMLDTWIKSQELRSLPNVAIIEDVPYDQYPGIYSQCDVYLSCSTVEGGGPNSMLEAMMSNIVPVVSDVGNAREFIVQGSNGFIFPLGSSSSEVISLIEKAYKLKPEGSDIYETVQSFTWKEFSRCALEYLLPNLTLPVLSENTSIEPLPPAG